MKSGMKPVPGPLKSLDYRGSDLPGTLLKIIWILFSLTARMLYTSNLNCYENCRRIQNPTRRQF